MCITYIYSSSYIVNMIHLKFSSFFFIYAFTFESDSATKWKKKRNRPPQCYTISKLLLYSLTIIYYLWPRQPWKTLMILINFAWKQGSFDAFFGCQIQDNHFTSKEIGGSGKWLRPCKLRKVLIKKIRMKSFSVP